MSANSKVSVVIPTYKRSEYITRAVESVLNQSYKNIELIIVDDNEGNDEHRVKTKTELAKYINTGQVIYIEHEYNKGLPAARNTGIKLAKGLYVAFLDDDDVWHKEKIYKQIEVFNSLPSEYGVVSCYWNEIDIFKGVEVIRKINYRGDLSKILALNHFSPPSNILVKKSYLDAVDGFDESFRWRQDIELYYRLSFICKFEFVEEALVDYYKHENAMSTNHAKRLIAVEDFVEKHKVSLKQNKLPWSEIHERLGELYALNGYKYRAYKAFSNSFINRINRPQILIKLFISLFGKKIYKSALRIN